MSDALHARELAALSRDLVAAFGEVDAFAWKQGARGGKYWLPDGKQDVPANRLYGAKATKAAGAEKATAKSGAGPREPSAAAKEKIARAKFEVARDAHAQAVRDKLPADKVEWLRNRAAKAAEELRAVAKPKPAPKPRPRPKPAAPGVLDRLAAVPGQILEGVGDTIQAAHRKLKERYGSGAANAVIATGALGVPIPIPGAALATAAPALAVAEIGRQLGFLKGEKPRGRTKQKLDATHRELVAAVERFRKSPAESTDDAVNALLDRTLAGRTPDEVKELARRVTGHKSRTPADARQRLHADMTAVRRIIESQNV